MSLMILISAVIAGRSLNKTVSGEFNGIATENALIVQSVIDTASNTATTIQNYMLDRYDEYSKNDTAAKWQRVKSMTSTCRK